ncbi:MAG: hypothetical protein ACFCAD_15630, partial [Pleurocapsa sp.]
SELNYFRLILAKERSQSKLPQDSADALSSAIAFNTKAIALIQIIILLNTDLRFYFLFFL